MDRVDPKCDHCDKQAVANFQRVWVRWGVNPSGSYSKLPSYEAARELNRNDEPTDENNIHVCADHEEKLLDGEI